MLYFSEVLHLWTRLLVSSKQLTQKTVTRQELTRHRVNKEADLTWSGPLGPKIWLLIISPLVAETVSDQRANICTRNCEFSHSVWTWVHHRARDTRREQSGIAFFEKKKQSSGMHERKSWGTIEFENMEAGLGTYVGNGGYVWLDVDEFIYCIINDSGLWFLKLLI